MTEMVVDGRRIRLLFEDKDDILSPTQKLEGLNLCWFMLQPQFHITIADFSAHILQSFGLQPACPHGIVLYMDDILLPPFETSEILDGRDIISVRKKGQLLSLEGNNVTIALDDPEMGKCREAQNGTLLLENEEFEMESDSSKGEEECVELVCEDELENVKEHGKATSNKRKAAEELRGSQKRKKLSSVAGSVATTSQMKDHAEEKKVQKPDKKLRPLKKTNGRDDREKAELDDGYVDASYIMKCDDHGQCQKNENEGQDGSAGTEKIPSRSARRKKAKRQWLQEMKKIQKLKGLEWKKPNKAERKTKNNWKRAVKPDEKKDDGEPKRLEPKWISWEPPGKGWTKCNTDASCVNFDGNGKGQTTIGGVFRDDQGRWLRGFMGALGRNKIYIAEMLAIREAISIARDYGVVKLEVESDSRSAVVAIGIQSRNEDARAIIDDIVSMKNAGMDVKVYYKQRKANRAADRMARNAHNSNLGVVRVQDPPENIVGILADDLRGLRLPR